MSKSPRYAVLIPAEEGWEFIYEGDPKFQMRPKTFRTIDEAKCLGDQYGVYEIVEMEE